MTFTKSQQAIYAALQAHAFNGPECHPSQDLIAVETGYSRRTVVTVLRELRAMGAVSWRQERRQGEKGRWRHNVYTLKTWQPPLRSRTVEQVANARAVQRAQCEATVRSEKSGRSNREKQPCRSAQSPSEKSRELTSPLLTKGKALKEEEGSYAVDNSNVYGSTNVYATSQNATTQSVQNSEPECERCVELAHDKARLTQEIAGLNGTVRTLGHQIVGLRNELAKQREDDPASDDVKELMHLWRDEVMGGDKRIKIPMDSDRATRSKWALKHYGKARCADAIMGVTLDDWAMGRDPRTKGRKFCDLAKHVFDTPYNVERFEDLWHKRNDPKPQLAPAPPLQPRRLDPWPEPVQRMLDKLEHVKTGGLSQWTARCPAHEDRNASLSVGVGDRGAVVVHCHAGCDSERIAAAVGIPLHEWFPYEAPIVSQPPLARPAASQAPADALPTEDDLKTMVTAMLANTKLHERLKAVKGWTPGTLAELGVGWSTREHRLVLPVRDPAGLLINVCLYRPNGTPKMIGRKGRKRDLFPAPETLTGKQVWIVEGEPDAITAHEIGLPATAVPGTNGWRPEWAGRFAQRRVIVCMDSDQVGRQASHKIVESVARHVLEVRAVDLAPTREDGYDLADFVRDGGTLEGLLALANNAVQVLRLGGDAA